MSINTPYRSDVAAEHVYPRAMMDRANGWCGGRLVSALEGGYAPELLGAACRTHMRALCEV